MKKLAYSERWDLATIPYEKLASEVGRRNAMRKEKPGRAVVMYRCVCGWEGGARESRVHKCSVKKIVKED